jgi:hypothetical protein
MTNDFVLNRPPEICPNCGSPEHAVDKKMGKRFSGALGSETTKYRCLKCGMPYIPTHKVKTYIPGSNVKGMLR